MAFGDSDLPAFFAVQGETAVISGQSVQVFVDTPASPWMHGNLGSMEESSICITAPVTAFGALPVIGSSVTVRGGSYTIKSRKLPGDGRIVEFELKATAL
jgi:hypothetical protein